MSFSPYGMPCSGPRSMPRCNSASARAASASARSVVTRTKASSAPSSASMRASACVVRAAEVTVPSRNARPASAIDNSCSGPARRAFPLQKQTLLRTFRRLIDSHYRGLRLPKEYADLLYITPNHLNALCQDLLGKTAGELIRDRTLLEAKRLLTNAKMTATEIAYELNFKDNSYFNRFFKKNAGMTPDDFRKSLLHNKNK